MTLSTDLANEPQSRSQQVPCTQNNPYTFSPVTVTDSLGVVVLGVLATILTLALARSEARNRELVRQLAQPR